MLPALVFDLDGTLIDSVPGIASALTAAFAAAGRILPATDLRTVIGPPIRTLALSLDPTLTPAELDLLEPAFRTHYDTSGWRETVLFPTVIRTLQTLQTRGHHLLLLTNKPRIPTVAILHHLALQPLFDAVLTRDSTIPPFSTKSAMLTHLLATHSNQQNPAQPQAIMVGDTPEDSEAAQSNHLPFVFAAYGYGQLPSAKVSITTFSELLTLDLKALHTP